MDDPRPNTLTYAETGSALVLLGIIVALSIPPFLVLIESREIRVTQRLESVARGNRHHRLRWGAWADDLAELRRRVPAARRAVRKLEARGLRLEYARKGSQWSLRASGDPSGRSYFVDASGLVRRDAPPRLGPRSPPVYR